MAEARPLNPVPELRQLDLRMRSLVLKGKATVR